jgi:NadR type nicotinamide-nucleotide adenylyltransferase
MPDETHRVIRGLVLGKFLPPHRGHQYLVDFARGYADHVTVHVCSIPTEPIPGELRFRWMREQFAGCEDVRVVHCDDLNPQAPEECPTRFWDIWRESLLSRMDTPPDLVFASEPYGARLAATLGAAYVPVDIARGQVPISGTQIRADVIRHWRFLLPPARPHFAKRVAIVGPESSGKSTLTTRLASRFGAVWAAEYARGYLAARPEHWVGADGVNGFDQSAIEAILRGQRASVEAAARQTECGLVISDTEAIVTACWSEALLGEVAPLAEEFVRSQRFDLYLVMAATEDWVQDTSQRVQPALAERRRFEDAVTARLEANGYPYVRLRGSWLEREATAAQAVAALLAR